MLVLADTNILLRLFDQQDPFHETFRRAIQTLSARGDQIAIAPQSIAELWNVSTRPATARGGYGLPSPEVDRRVRVLERAFVVLPETPDLYHAWRNLVLKYNVQGVNVHDARLVAFMLVHQISHLLTANVRDFSRFSEITTLPPATLT